MAVLVCLIAHTTGVSLGAILGASRYAHTARVHVLFLSFLRLLEEFIKCSQLTNPTFNCYLFRPDLSTRQSAVDMSSRSKSLPSVWVVGFSSPSFFVIH